MQACACIEAMNGFLTTYLEKFDDCLNYMVKATAIIVIMKIIVTVQAKKAMLSNTSATIKLVRYKWARRFIGCSLYD